jgi:hypothetical protein
VASLFSITQYDYVVTGDLLSGITVTVEPRIVQVTVSTGPITFGGTTYSLNSGAGTPLNVETPDFAGQLYTDTSTGQIWVSFGTASSDWVELVRNY